jgi:hypothetical protein
MLLMKLPEVLESPDVLKPHVSHRVARSMERYMQPDDKAQPFDLARLTIRHWRRHSLFAAQMTMALTVAALLALTLAGAENYFAAEKGLSAQEAVADYGPNGMAGACMSGAVRAPPIC